MLPERRSSAFAVSDIRSAAEEFVHAVAEHADTIWDQDDLDMLADGIRGQIGTPVLTERAFDVICDAGKSFR